MKLATLKNGTRDGRLVVVSRDLTRYTDASFLAPTLQAALDDWQRLAPHLAALAESLDHGAVPSARFHENDAHSPLPRAYQWADGFGLRQPRRTGAQIAWQRNAGRSSDRPADLPGRFGRLPRPARPDRAGRRGLGHRFRGRGRRRHRRRADGRESGRGEGSRSAWSCWSTTSACALSRPASSPRGSASSSRSRPRRFRRSR